MSESPAANSAPLCDDFNAQPHNPFIGDDCGCDRCHVRREIATLRAVHLACNLGVEPCATTWDTPLRTPLDDALARMDSAIARFAEHAEAMKAVESSAQIARRLDRIEDLIRRLGRGL